MFTTDQIKEHKARNEAFREKLRKQVVKQLRDRKITRVAENLGVSYPTINNVMNPDMPVSFKTLTALVGYFEGGS